MKSYKSTESFPKKYKRQSYITCKHKNVQSFTECCLDCGYNVWTTDKDYLKELQNEAREPGITSIRVLEKLLGITR
jgi:hypothetical protein